MGRPPRLFTDGVYHVASHGSDNRQLFYDNGDRREFLSRLGLTFWKLELELISYVLMGNHYHSLVYTPDDRLSRGLKEVHGGYSRAHNKRHNRGFHLFRAHCFARRIADNDDLLATSRYLALNPVEAGFVVHPLDWPWSSARVHAGLEPPTIPLNEDKLRAAFDDNPHWRDRYREFIEPTHARAERTLALAT
jgi:putative transposase